MPTFCRHNRFIERCPICSRTLPGREPATGGAGQRQSARGSGPGPGGAHGSAATGRHRRLRTGGNKEVRVRREERAEDDGFSSALAPGLHASDDAARLAEEIGFASGRLLRLHAAPPDLFAEIRALAGDGELERATWICFLAAYLSPLPGEDPFAGIRLALEREEVPREGAALEGVPLGPRTSHDPARGEETLRAYRHWAEHAGGQAPALTGESFWTPQRRFERVFERLALPGFTRMGRYELLVTLGRLGLYELEADALHLAAGTAASNDLTTLAAKRILGTAEPILLERRALVFAQELSVPVDVLDLAFANWGAGERATLGFKPDSATDPHAAERARDALGL
jgi:hypothetical protein